MGHKLRLTKEESDCWQKGVYANNRLMSKSEKEVFKTRYPGTKESKREET